MKTYGTYEYVPPDVDESTRGVWVLTIDPSERMRARRLFGRTQQTRTLALTMADTRDVCRDIAWFCDRYPLEPVDEESRQRLAAGAAEHRAMEQLTELVLAGHATREHTDHTPEKEPREYQQIAVDLLRARGALLLTDEVGLGKTFTGLLSLLYEDALPALVVPPTHLPRRWETELREAFPWLTFHTVKDTKARPAIYDHLPDVLIVPYTRLDGWAGHLRGKFQTVVFDEAQELRYGRTTKKGAAAAIVSGEARYVLGLTATPIYNYGGEIWNIYDILAPEVLGTREEFAREWASDSSSTVGGHMMVNDPSGLGAWLRDTGLMLGRTRTQVGRELPQTIKVQQTVDSDHNALADVQDIVAALAEKIMSSETAPLEKGQASREIDWRVRQATGVDKAPYVADFVRLLLESEERIVMWGWHRDVYDIWLEKLGDLRPLLYTGSESPTQKAKAEQLFTIPISEEYPLDQAHRILIMSLRSGSGVDGLQKVARVGVFGELDWSPEVHEQAIGRLRRDGMGEDPPVAYFLTSEDGSDPAMLEVLGIKRQQAEPLVNPDGGLYQATHDNSRARMLAEQILKKGTR